MKTFEIHEDMNFVYGQVSFGKETSDRRFFRTAYILRGIITYKVFGRLSETKYDASTWMAVVAEAGLTSGRWLSRYPWFRPSESTISHRRGYWQQLLLSITANAKFINWLKCQHHVRVQLKASEFQVIRNRKRENENEYSASTPKPKRLVTAKSVLRQECVLRWRISFGVKSKLNVWWIESVLQRLVIRTTIK